MLARLLLLSTLLVGFANTAAGAQTQLFSPQQPFAQTDLISENRIRVSPVRYSPVVDNEADEVDPLVLEEQLKLMELRLRELELDVEKKIESVSKGQESEGVDEVALGERLASLERSFQAQGEAVQGLENTLPALTYHSHKNPKMEIFGRIHLDYWSFPKVDDTLFPLEGVLPTNPQDRIEFRRLRIGVKGDLTDNMFYKYEGEFAGGVNTSYRDAYLGFKHLPFLNTVIIGNHKRPYGLDHLNSSRFNVFTERPFIVEAFNQDNRRLGISSNGYSEDERYNWRFGTWNQQLTQDSSGYVGDHYQLEVAGRFAATPWYDETSGGRGYAHLGLSGSVGVPDGRAGSTNNQAEYRTRAEARSSGRWLDTGPIAGANENYLIGLESVVNVGAVQFTGEYMRNNVDRRDAVGEDVAFDGGYAQVSYFLTGEHIPWNRQRGVIGRIQPFENFFLVRDCDCDLQQGWGAWQVAARYSYADLTDKDIVGGEGESMTLGLNWYWNAYARMQFNYIVGDIERQPAGFGDYEIFGVRLMVDF